jgi:hypothetical protein
VDAGPKAISRRSCRRYFTGLVSRSLIPRFSGGPALLDSTTSIIATEAASPSDATLKSGGIHLAESHGYIPARAGI